MLEIRKGSMHIHAAFEVGFELSTKKVLELIGSRYASRANELRPLSQSINRDLEPLRIAFDPVQIKLADEVLPFQVFVTFYELGALSFEFVCPLHTSFDVLPELASQLEQSDGLIEAAKHLAKEIFSLIRSAIVGPELFPNPSVHYVFNIEELSEDLSSDQLITRAGTTIAKTMKASTEAIGANEVKRTLQQVVGYSDRDLVFVTTKNAIVFDEDGLDAVDILELANVQSLELRYLDGKLDRTLVKLYETNSQKKSWFKRLGSRLFNMSELNLNALNTIHLDSLIIAERVEQSFKLASDAYLSRVHELCVNTMFLRVLSAGIDRKLSAIRDISNDIQDAEGNLRMETLEWIIIILIIIGTIPIFLTGKGH
ncbi:MAG: hypothetical protein ABIR96_05420 [Bdellovibrionota bacterium]